jgi:hypothetical protein
MLRGLGALDALDSFVHGFKGLGTCSQGEVCTGHLGECFWQLGWVANSLARTDKAKPSFWRAAWEPALGMDGLKSR